MRLERFSSWYDNEIYGRSKYLGVLERIYKNAEGRTGNLWDIAELKWRYRLMAALNPLRPKCKISYSSWVTMFQIHAISDRSIQAAIHGE